MKTMAQLRSKIAIARDCGTFVVLTPEEAEALINAAAVPERIEVSDQPMKKTEGQDGAAPNAGSGHPTRREDCSLPCAPAEQPEVREAQIDAGAAAYHEYVDQAALREMWPGARDMVAFILNRALATRPLVGQRQAWTDVQAERQRQISVEGWTPQHDDQHANDDLARAASCYALPANRRWDAYPAHWPWDPEWWKPGDRRRELVKAGALILAEIERLDRAAPSPVPDEGAK